MKVTLKAARVNKGLTIAEAAKTLGISPATLISYEKGVTPPKQTTLEALLALYGASYNDIIFCSRTIL